MMAVMTKTDPKGLDQEAWLAPWCVCMRNAHDIVASSPGKLVVGERYGLDLPLWSSGYEVLARAEVVMTVEHPQSSSPKKGAKAPKAPKPQETKLTSGLKGMPKTVIMAPPRDRVYAARASAVLRTEAGKYVALVASFDTNAWGGVAHVADTPHGAIMFLDAWSVAALGPDLLKKVGGEVGGEGGVKNLIGGTSTSHGAEASPSGT